MEETPTNSSTEAPKTLQEPSRKTLERLFGASFRPTKKGFSRKPSWTEKLSILKRRPLGKIIVFQSLDLNKCCCGLSVVPFFQKTPLQQHVFVKVPFEIIKKKEKIALVEQTTLFTTSFRTRFCTRAYVDNASKRTKTPFLYVKWNLEKSLGIYLIPGAPKSQKLKTNGPRRHPEPLCRTSGVQFLSKNRQGHGMSKSRSSKASNYDQQTQRCLIMLFFRMF